MKQWTKELRFERKSKEYIPKMNTRKENRHTYTHNKEHEIAKMTRTNKLNEQLGLLWKLEHGPGAPIG